MFKARQKWIDRIEIVYGVSSWRNERDNEHAEFLIYSGEWRWEDADNYEPVVE
jgi:hypothetical protein